MLPERVPEAVGLKTALMEQDPPAAIELPQVFVCEKSPPLVPVTVTLVIVSAAVPVLVKVTTEAGLEDPTD